MTSDEARAMIRDLATTYPHLQDFITGLPVPESTLREWCKILSPVRADFAAAAVRRIKSGATAMPTSRWDLSVLPNLIRSLCARMADEEAKRNREAAVKSHSDERQRPKSRINFGQCWRLAMAAGACKADGRISPERNAEIMDYIKHMQSNHETEPLEIPDDVRAEYELGSGGFRKP